MSKSKALEPLAGKTWTIKYKDGHTMSFVYPSVCNKCQAEVGDYCWGLAVANEEGKSDEFVKKHCPCFEQKIPDAGAV